MLDTVAAGAQPPAPPPADGAPPATPPATPPVDTGKDGAPATPPGDGQQPPAPATPAAPAVPDTYDLKLPDNSPLDAAALERTAATARALGLSPDAAQKALEFVHSEVAAQRAALLAAHQPGGAAWTTQVEQWKAQTLADETLGKTPEERTAAAQRGHQVMLKYAEQNPADAEAMKSFLNESGLGNHPAAVRFFAWIGKAMAEGSMVMASSRGGSSQADTLALLYPTMQPKS